MIESFLVAGQQAVKKDQTLIYGQSITDACVDLSNSEEMLMVLAKSIKDKRMNKLD